jgi:hypothetical protein
LSLEPIVLVRIASASGREKASKEIRGKKEGTPLLALPNVGALMPSRGVEHFAAAGSDDMAKRYRCGTAADRGKS